jgi:hypothetical protein
MYKFEVYKDKAGEFRFRFKAPLLRQLQLDPSVRRPRLRRIARRDGLELTEAGRDQAVGRHALLEIRNLTTEVARADDSSQLSR